MPEDAKLDSLRKSKWKLFDREFAKMIKEEHPDIWAKGGNIKGNDQYEILTKIASSGGVAQTDSQVAAIELREAWVARHKDDFRLPGVIAQIKWLAVGSRGEDHMKNVVREAIKKKGVKMSDLEIDQIGNYLEHRGLSDDEIDDFLEHFGVKGMKWGQRRAVYKSQVKEYNRAAKSNRKVLRSHEKEARALYAKSRAAGNNAFNDKKLKSDLKKLDKKTVSQLTIVDKGVLDAGERHTRRMLTGTAIATAALYVGFAAVTSSAGQEWFMNRAR